MFGPQRPTTSKSFSLKGSILSLSLDSSLTLTPDHPSQQPINPQSSNLQSSKKQTIIQQFSRKQPVNQQPFTAAPAASGDNETAVTTVASSETICRSQQASSLLTTSTISSETVTPSQQAPTVKYSEFGEQTVEQNKTALNAEVNIAESAENSEIDRTNCPHCAQVHF